MMRSSVRSRLSVLTLVAAVAACSESSTEPPAMEDFDFQVGNALLAPGAGVTLRAEAAQWCPGAPATLTLENNSSSTVGFNLCFHALERRNAETWSPMQDARVCTAHLDTAAAGASHSQQTHLPQALPAGEYRFRVALYLGSENTSRDVASQPFQVGN